MAAEPHVEQQLLVSKARASELLSISIDTFERLVMPEVRTVRIGRRVLFAVSDLARWVDEHTALPLLAQLPHRPPMRVRDAHAARGERRSTSRRFRATVERTTKNRAGADGTRAEP